MTSRAQSWSACLDAALPRIRARDGMPNLAGPNLLRMRCPRLWGCLNGNLHASRLYHVRLAASADANADVCGATVKIECYDDDYDGHVFEVTGLQSPQVELAQIWPEQFTECEASRTSGPLTTLEQE